MAVPDEGPAPHPTRKLFSALLRMSRPVANWSSSRRSWASKLAMASQMDRWASRSGRATGSVPSTSSEMVRSARLPVECVSSHSRASGLRWFSVPEQVDTDLAAATAWAGRMAEGGAESAKLLRAVDGLPERARGPVTALANRPDALSGIHRSASRAPTRAEFGKRWNINGDEDASGEEWEARLALGLPVEDEVEDGGEPQG